MDPNVLMLLVRRDASVTRDLSMMDLDPASSQNSVDALFLDLSTGWRSELRPSVTLAQGNAHAKVMAWKLCA
jgi:hypothetical protein